MNTTAYLITRLTVACAAGGALLLGTTACTTAAVDKADVAQQITQQLGAQGVTIDGNAVTCTEDLPAEVGATRTCDFRTGGQPVGAVVRVTAVDGSRTSFDITTEARPVPQALLQDMVSDEVARQTGVPIDRTSCKGDLPAHTGDKVGCTVTAGEESLDLAVSVTGVTGGKVDFSIASA